MSARTVESWEFEGFRLESVRGGCFWHGDEIVHLHPKAIEVLQILVRNHHRVVTRQELIEQVWSDTFVEDGNLTFTVSCIRKSLREAGAEKEFVRTITKVGYRFIPNVSENLPTGERMSSAVASGGHFNGRRAKTLIFLALLPILLLTSYLAWRYAVEAKPSTTAGFRGKSIDHIAVFPPKSLSGANDDKELRFAVADALVTRIGSLGLFRVRPISSTLGFEDSGLDEVSYAKDLNVDAILAATYLEEDGLRRLSFRLIDARDGTVIWTDVEDISSDDLLATQQAVSARVIEKLLRELRRGNSKPPAIPLTSSDEAYRLYLRGKYIVKLRLDIKERAPDLFRKAIELDPNFAEAYVGLADSLAFGEPPQQGLDRAIEIAIELKPALADAWATRGFVQMFHHWDWSAARDSFERAIELDPQNTKARHWYGVYYSLRGEFGRARREMLLALEGDPTSVFIRNDLAQLYYFENNYEAATKEYRGLLDLDPVNHSANYGLSTLYFLAGKLDESGESFIKSVAFDSDFQSRARRVFRESGYWALMRVRIEAQDCRNLQKIPPIRCAELTLMSGKKSEAIDYLEKSLSGRMFLLPFIAVDPLWDDVRDDPRFSAIVGKMNLERKGKL